MQHITIRKIGLYTLVKTLFNPYPANVENMVTS